LRRKKKWNSPGFFTASQFVFVETVYGAVNDTNFDPRVSPEDRAAVYRVEDALRSWARYRLATKRSEAELVFVVRKGALVAGHAGVKISRAPQPPGGPSQPGTTVGPVLGAEAGPPHDLLCVYTKNPDGSLGGPAWKRTQDHGLDAPDVPLLKNFKDAVEGAAAKQAKKTP
jgi:hypothetical protein